MSTYKVIQDIEAEDHILGPLSLRQFIYGLIAAFFLYLSFISVAKHVPFLLIFWLPPAIFTGFFAFPFGKDQPTEVWALAKIRFLFKPRKRIWNQSGVKELVTITVPKKIEIQRTNGLTQMEVKSRLQALADTIDTRGWAIKNVAGNSGYVQLNPLDDGERLLNLQTMPRAVPDYELPASADILDEQASPLAQQFTNMIKTSAKTHRQKLMAELAKARTDTRQAPTEPVAVPAKQWFAQSPLAGPQPVTAQATVPSDAALTADLQQRLAAQAQANLHMHSIPSQSDAQATAVPAEPVASNPSPAPQPVTPPTDPAILNLAKNNDLNVATLAREAHKTKDLEAAGGEVVIALH